MSKNDITSADIKTNKDLIIMIMALGDAYLEKGLYAEAIRRYSQLLQNKIANKHIYTNLSKAMIGLKRFDRQALAIYQKAIEYDRSNVSIYHVLARSFLKDNREDAEAIRTYEVALQTDTPDFATVADSLSQIYYRNGEFDKCATVAQNQLQKQGYHEKAITYFLECSWRTQRYDQAINELKMLMDKYPAKENLGKYLCITYLEKSHHGFLQDKPMKYSFIDRQITQDYLKNMAKLKRLQDLAFFLEIERFLSDSEYWGNLDLLEQDPEEALVLQEAEGGTEVHRASAREGIVKTRNRQLVRHLNAFDKLSTQEFSSRSSLTFDDFQTRGAAIFEQSAVEENPLHLPEGSEIIIVIEWSNFDALSASLEQDGLFQLRNKLIFMLLDVLDKYRIHHVHAATNGFIIFAKDIINSVSLCVDLLNKTNKFNFADENNHSLHLTVGIHHTRNGLNIKNEELLKELCTAVKLGLVNEADLPEDDRPMYAKVFQKSDRILLSSKAYRAIKGAKRFRVGTIGQFKLKYLKDNLTIHEVSWRNPIEDLKLGYIRTLGRFNLLAEIGDTGGIRVFKAKDPDLQRFVILKVIQSEMFNALPANNPHKIEFYQVTKRLAQMNHPNIANIYDVDDDHGLTFIVRQFIEGTTITERFRERNGFNAELFIKIIYQVFKGLHYCHRLGYYHHNLKPTNIRIGENNETKIMDFLIPGSALADYSNHLTGAQRMYQAPEQLQGDKGDARSDIFSFGMVMYEAVTGRHPFADKSYRTVEEAILNQKPVRPSELNPRVPKFCDALILKCLAKHPENRVQSAEQVVTLLKKNFEKILFSRFNYQLAQSRTSF